jgi:hypothetical protein
MTNNFRISFKKHGMVILSNINFEIFCDILPSECVAKIKCPIYVSRPKKG